MKITAFLIKLFGAAALLCVGIGIGAFLFSRTIPRSFLATTDCKETCLDQKEILGLFSSVGIQRFSNVMPLVEFETDKTIVIRHPKPQAPIHYVIIPKKDIKNIGTLAPTDEPYVIDSYAAIQRLVQEKKLTRYKVLTNGPGYQDVTYLHFHLLAPKQ